MYFLMAWIEEPPRSLSVEMAALTMVEVGGWLGLVPAPFFLAAAPFAFLGVAAAGVAGVAVAVVSVIPAERVAELRRPEESVFDVHALSALLQTLGGP